MWYFLAAFVLLAAPCFMYIFHAATRKNQLFGFVERFADKLYGTKWAWLEKILGGCYMCWSNAWGVVVATSLLLFADKFFLNIFLTILINVLLGIFATNFMTVLSMYIYSVFNKNKDGVNNGIANPNKPNQP